MKGFRVASTPSSQLRKLDALVGKWKSEGETVTTDSETSIRISGTDIYEWLPGGFFMIHHVDVKIGDEQVNVIEMIGGNEEIAGFPMRAFDNHGNYSVMHATVDPNGVWTFAGESTRARLTVSDDRKTMKAHWERSDNGSYWQPWMEMRFTKLD
jgi:hypothetical protein